MKKSKLQLALDQRQWMEEHGETLAGYVARYGTPSAPDFTRWSDGYYGAGGEAIYAADRAELVRLEVAAGIR